MKISIHSDSETVVVDGVLEFRQSVIAEVYHDVTNTEGRGRTLKGQQVDRKTLDRKRPSSAYANRQKGFLYQRENR